MRNPQFRTSGKVTMKRNINSFEIYWAGDARIHVARSAEPRHLFESETSPDQKHLKSLILTSPADVLKGDDPLCHAEQFEHAAREAAREFLGEVLVKCSKCGFEAGKSFGPMGSISFGFEKDFYPACPVITDKLHKGALQGPLWAHCPHFRDAATKVRRKAA
jgi:hypothetical protein